MSSRARSRRSPASGFTLLGVIVAGGMVALVLVVLSQLATRTGHVTRVTKNRLIATSLAREGIELVRAIRDNNWLSSSRCPPPDPANRSTYVCTIPWRGRTQSNTAPDSLCTLGGREYYRVDAQSNPPQLESMSTEDDVRTRLYRSGETYFHQ